MRRRRARGTGRPPAAFATAELCRGPGNLTRALGITLQQNLLDLTASALRIEDRGLPARAVAWSRRIGINVGVEAEWRVLGARTAPAVSGRAADRQRAAPAVPRSPRAARQRRGAVVAAGRLSRPPPSP